MEFKVVLKTLIERFNQEGIDFALMGAFGMSVTGIIRTTEDLDFLIPERDAIKVSEIMESLGYETLWSGPETSHYVSPLASFGRVDFLHARRKYSRRMLQQAKQEAVFNGAFMIKVVRPEDIIGLKVQSSSNDPSRYYQDMSDIEQIVKRHYQGIISLDMGLVREYFKIFDREKELDDLIMRGRNAG
ncbi:MAG: nucleotidyltransferase [Dissulfuribacterales bacterium]